MNHVSSNRDGPHAGLSVLVVEDETLVAINLESILEDLGHTVIGPVMRLDELETMVDGGVEADLAILDINLAGAEVFPQAERLSGAGMPIVFTTGYGAKGLTGNWSEFPVIQKPYTADDIAEYLSRLKASEPVSVGS
ncbi:response regulator [Oricola cellulosilytica]|uniref:Response regulator n=1 Tax=Oricola cellulosilytica TaxID=1429082 RepID=A0A4R0P343_9HYPH|nr:response regulator [Oricola cellulosilytica]TCD10981.1 response regulator [Oricola cellulosilytica]